MLCELSQSEILRLYSIVYVAMKTTKTSNFTCQSKSFISIFFTCQVSASELQPSWFSCHDLANDIYSETAKTVFSHLRHQSTTINKLLNIMAESDFKERSRSAAVTEVKKALPLSLENTAQSYLYNFKEPLGQTFGRIQNRNHVLNWVILQHKVSNDTLA